MPERLIHCRTCRTLLNTDLEPDSVEIPQFMPLQEIESVPQLPVRGYYTVCPQCSRELRINRRFTGKKVTCKHCTGEFVLDFNDPNIEKVGVYVNCPKCAERLRMSLKYLGIKVACKACQCQLTVIDD
jgi:uncharacterized protein (DUF983 family)